MSSMDWSKSWRIREWTTCLVGRGHFGMRVQALLGAGAILHFLTSSCRRVLEARATAHPAAGIRVTGGGPRRIIPLITLCACETDHMECPPTPSG